MATNNGERGTALVTGLLMLALMLALAMGITLTAISELGVSTTYGNQTLALQAAEGGLNHAVSLISNYEGDTFTDLLALRPGHPDSLSTNYLTGNNPFISAKAEYFADGVPMIDQEDTQRGYQLRSAQIDPATGKPVLVEGAYYTVSLIDDEPSSSTAPIKVPNFIPGSTYRESVAPNANSATIDKNNRIVVYSTGTYANTSVTLEGWVAFLPYPALSANDDINISGNTEISGLYGGVHSNGNLIAGGGGGNSWHVEQTATAAGQIVGTFDGHVDGFFGGGQARLELPPFVTMAPLSSGGPNTSPRLQDFVIQQADRLLIDPGYAEGAHNSMPNGNGHPGSRRLASLAERLNIPYTTLANALDSDTDRGNNVQQSGEAALEVTRNSSGTVTSLVKRNLSDIGWGYSGGSNAHWSIDTGGSGLVAGGKTYYVIGQDNYNDGPTSSTNPSTKNGGNVKLTGNVGSSGPALTVTILATGSIEIGGTPNIVAKLTDLQTPLLPPFIKVNMLMAAVQDIKVNGDFDAQISFTGVSFAGEQVELSGNGSINGQVIALSNKHVNGTPVGSNTITGSFELTLNDGNSIGRISLFSWRQIKR